MLAPMVRRARSLLPDAVDQRVAQEVRARRLREVDAALIAAGVLDRRRLRTYTGEVRRSGLLSHLRDAAADFRRSASGTTRGQRNITGAIAPGAGERMYAVLRAHRPDVVVETGVCNGFSTAFVLAALERNGHGRLHSVDLPEYANVDTEGVFWDEKVGEVVPEGREPGWAIPRSLRHRWELSLGPSQELLPQVLDRAGALDVFIHDSEHSYECMTFEMHAAWPRLREGGLMIVDDWVMNEATRDFARAHGAPLVPVGPRQALIRKVGVDGRPPS
jgi:predicted O-methyltransferase YrrM